MSWVAPLVSWAPKLNAKVFFTSKDQYDAMIAAILNDKLLRPNHKGLRRAVRITHFTLPIFIFSDPFTTPDIQGIFRSLDDLHHRNGSLSVKQ